MEFTMLADDGQLTYEIMNRAVFKPTRLPGSIRYGAQDRGRCEVVQESGSEQRMIFCSINDAVYQAGGVRFRLMSTILP
jgi:hypothetical protein